jgi:hypothetical protein
MPAARPTQGDLFAQAVRPRARKGAPATAKVAAARAEYSAAAIAWKALELVAGVPLTADEAAERILDHLGRPTPWPRVRPRFTNLHDAKLIRRTGLERPSGLGNPMAVCEATPEGRELLARRPRPHQPCELYTIKPRGTP